MSEILTKLKIINNKIIIASSVRQLEDKYIEPQLIAVSKFQPIEAIINAYEVGQKYFGENYVNELSKKANNSEVLHKCIEIKWHFIGHLQSNNINKLLKVPNLDVVQTVDSEKIACALNKAWTKLKKSNNLKLKIMIQVNTSEEEAKGGCQMKNVLSIVKYVLDSCFNLQFIGLMTIGKYGYNIPNIPNPDFLILKDYKNKICNVLSIEPKDVKLSMGMSSDFEQAVELGSSYVRVGTAIFGDRSTLKLEES